MFLTEHGSLCVTKLHEVAGLTRTQKEGGGHLHIDQSSAVFNMLTTTIRHTSAEPDLVVPDRHTGWHIFRSRDGDI